MIIGNSRVRFLVQGKGDRVTKASTKEARGNQIAFYNFVVNVNLFLNHLVLFAVSPVKDTHTVNLIQVDEGEVVHKANNLVFAIQGNDTYESGYITIIVYFAFIVEIAVRNIYSEDDGGISRIVFPISSFANADYHLFIRSTRCGESISYSLGLKSQCTFNGIVNTARKVDAWLSVEIFNGIGTILCATQSDGGIYLPAYCFSTY